MAINKCIYLDNSATTPLSAASRQAIDTAAECFGNPSSLHTLGQAAESLISRAREQIMTSLGVRRGQGRVIFTSCGTEATSTAIFGTAYAKKRRTASRILTTDSEHHATGEALASLAEDGFEIVRIPTVGGVLDMDALRSALDAPVFLATFMLVNNETGALYNVKQAFSEIKQRYPQAITHCDAIQGFMRVRFTPSALGAELVSLSGHKVHAPKGVGALYISEELIRSKRIVPFIRGGGQEGGLRSGTENVMGICAIGATVGDMHERREQIEGKLAALHAHAVSSLQQSGVRINAPHGTRVDHIINITLPDIKSETMLHFLSAKGIYVSSGSACASHSQGPSTALLAFGLSAHEADCSLRISLSEYNTAEEIDELCGALCDGIARLVKIKRK